MAAFERIYVGEFEEGGRDACGIVEYNSEIADRVRTLAE